MRVAVVLIGGGQSAREDFIEKHDLLDDCVRIGGVCGLRKKMKKGAFCIIDNFVPHDHGVELDEIRRKYLYKTLFVDLKSRKFWMPASPLEDCKVIKKSDIPRHRNFKTWLDKKLFPVEDLNHTYESVYHIGDIHGCHRPLKTFLSDHFNTRSLYVFCGDYLDRGRENGETFLELYDLKNKPNVVLLWGNHESELIRWANGRPLKNPDFRDRTRLQLEEAGISPQTAHHFCRRLRDFYVYQYDKRIIFCSHAGLFEIPRRFLTLESADLRGETTKDLKDLFERAPLVMHDSFNLAAKGTNWVQVHGHTNAQNHKMTAFPTTVLLNDQPENGKFLRVWRIDSGGSPEGQEIKIPSIFLP